MGKKMVNKLVLGVKSIPNTLLYIKAALKARYENDKNGLIIFISYLILCILYSIYGKYVNYIPLHLLMVPFLFKIKQKSVHKENYSFFENIFKCIILYGRVNIKSIINKFIKYSGIYRILYTTETDDMSYLYMDIDNEIITMQNIYIQFDTYDEIELGFKLNDKLHTEFNNYDIDYLSNIYNNYYYDSEQICYNTIYKNLYMIIYKNSDDYFYIDIFSINKKYYRHILLCDGLEAAGKFIEYVTSPKWKRIFKKIK